MHLEKISRLRNDEDYYGAYGKQFLSNSDIDTLINNPADFQKPSEDKIEYKFGRAFHELVMFGDSEHIEEVVEASTRTTKIYKEAVAEAGQMLFLQKEYDQLMFLVDKFQSNKRVDVTLYQCLPSHFGFRRRLAPFVRWTFSSSQRDAARQVSTPSHRWAWLGISS